MTVRPEILWFLLIGAAVLLLIGAYVFGRRNASQLGTEDLQVVIAARPAYLLRTYIGRSDESNRFFQIEADWLAEQGYQPVSHSWVPGEWGSGAYIFALVLTLVVGVGLVVFAYLWTVKPNGTLSVLYTLV